LFQKKLDESGIFLALILNTGSLVFFFKNLKQKATQPADSDFPKILARLNELPEGLVMCLPQQWYDQIGYKTKQNVMWGGHGYGFKRVESSFPILRKPIRELVREHGITYLVTQDDYLPNNFLEQLSCGQEDRFGKYHIYHLKNE